MGLGKFKNRGQAGVPPGGAQSGKVGFTSDRYGISDCQVVSDIAVCTASQVPSRVLVRKDF
jgi:hypothetical protein